MLKTGITGTIGRWSARHPWTAITLWAAFVAAAVVIGSAVGTKQLTPAESGSGESGKAAHVLDSSGFKIQPAEEVLVQSKTLTASDPRFHAVVADVIARLDSVPAVSKLRSPYAHGAISPDGHSVLVGFELPGTFQTVGSKVGPALGATRAAQVAHPAFTIEETGDASFAKAYNDTQGKDFKQAEQLSLPITLLILVVAFGGLLIAGIPVLLALSAVMAAFGLTAVASHAVPVTDTTKSVILLIGLAVGVDYSIFYIARQRQERAQGAAKLESIETAAATSGRAVLISGLTVMAAMSGMFLAGNSVFSGIALGTIIVVAAAVVGSLTVLPALLAPKTAGVLARVPGARPLGRVLRAAGHGIVWCWRVLTWPFRVAQAQLARVTGRRSLWDRVLTPVLRHPVIAAVSATAVLVVLSLPALGLSLGLAPQTYGMSKSLQAIKASDAIQKAFPGSPSPAVIAIKANDVTSPDVRAGLARFERAALATGQVHRPFTVQINHDRTVAEVYVPIAGSGHDAAAYRALATIRDDVLPQTLRAVPGVTAYVGGEAAGSHDFNQLMHDRAPLVIGFVLLLSFLLLLVTFRSIVVPVKAIVLNLLSVGAAYGILVAVFQHTWAQPLLGFTTDGHIESWLPIFLFVVLFGLSMDYHVFILSRVRELYDRGMSSDEAVAEGIRGTAGVVTSAAVVMVAVFAVFATLSGLDMKQLGVGLASAILIDATIIRGVLLPASMKLLGDRNWYLPSALGWLPHVSHGRHAPVAPRLAPSEA